ncbi:MAG: hypothetical protein ACYDDA_01560 [Acidiferrobacteraceae bacterium]
MDASAQSAETTIKSGLAFVASHIDVEGNLPVELIPHYVFRRARDGEIDRIRETIGRFSPQVPIFAWPPYEFTFIEKERSGSNRSIEKKRLPKEQWKYWVLAFEDTSELEAIEYVSLLLETDLEFGFKLLYSEAKQGGGNAGVRWAPDIVAKYASAEEVNKNARWTTVDQIKSIGTLYDLYKHVPEGCQFISHAVSNFSSLRSIPRRSELLTVGYFSIIESLITHKPRQAESLDSISHQVANKMILLQKKFSRTISCATYFSNVGEKKLWKDLYGYRSCLAHGDIPDFTEKFKTLKTHGSVVQFLRENIKELIILAMNEPEFITDLREC